MAAPAAEVRARLDAVIAALKEARLWDSAAAPEPATLARAGPYGDEVMSFAQWLRHVFVPSAETRLGNGDRWPDPAGVRFRAEEEAKTEPALRPVVAALAALELALDDATAKELMDRAESARATGRRDRAIACALAASAREPAHPNACNYAGWLLLEDAAEDAEKLTRALALFEKAVEVAPDRAAPLANYGDTMLRLGRRAEAFAWMRARSADPRSAAIAHNWLGYHALASGELAEAVSELRAAVKAKPRWGIATPLGVPVEPEVYNV